MTQNAQASLEQNELIRLYGLFMISWSIVEHVVQCAMWKNLGTDIERAAIVTAKLQFNPRVQLLKNLLQISGDHHVEAIKILGKLEGFAHRNTLVHGQIIIGDPQALTFIKSDGGNVLVKKFKVDQMTDHLIGLNSRTDRLEQLLAVTELDMQTFINHLVVKAGGIPKT